ncbi:MAG TPA: hypothetical protein GXX34_03400 [Clostridia bacterium]|nr:hypothetical protein [Clostridia bacterium]
MRSIFSTSLRITLCLTNHRQPTVKPVTAGLSNPILVDHSSRWQDSLSSKYDADDGESLAHRLAVRKILGSLDGFKL